MSCKGDLFFIVRSFLKRQLKNWGDVNLFTTTILKNTWITFKDLKQYK